MKLLYIGDGKSVHIYRWLSYFANKNYDVYLATDNPGFIPKITQYFISAVSENKIIHYYKMITEIKKLINEIKPDILHSHFISGYGYFGAFSKFHPFILTGWGSDIYVIPKRNLIARMLTSYALKQADLVTVDSEDAKQKICRLAPQNISVEVIFFGVDTNFFFPKDTKSAKEKLGLMGNWVILSLRRLEPLYNVASLLYSVNLVKKEILNLKLIIIGNGSEKPRLIRLAERLKLNENIIFLDYLPEEDLIEYISAADVYVSIPFSDSTSVALLEAMSCAKPVILSDIPSNREWVTNGVNGYLVSPRNRVELAKRIIELFQDENKRRQFGEINRQLVKEKAEYYKCMESVEKLYYKVAKRL